MLQSDIRFLAVFVQTITNPDTPPSADAPAAARGRARLSLKRLGWSVLGLAAFSNLYLLYALSQAMPTPSCSHQAPCGREQAVLRAEAKPTPTRPHWPGLAWLEPAR